MALLLNTVKQNWNHVSDALSYILTRLFSKYAVHFQNHCEEKNKKRSGTVSINILN